MNTTAHLTAHGRLTWTQALSLLAGCTCTWSDLDGIHLTPAPPAALPAGATHLWGWAADGRCIRLRLDHQAAYTAVLHTRPGTCPDTPDAETVTVTVRPAITWDPDTHRQAGPLPATIQAHSWELLEIPGPAPVTFVRARNAAP
jgi:hypothetical protein